MARLGPGDPDRRIDDSGRVSRELKRLDPWTYWVVPAPAEEFGDFVVLGTTGAFLVAAVGTEGYAETTGRSLKISGRKVGGMSSLRRSARRIRGRLASAAVFAEVEPVACLTRAPAGAPRTVGGVRAVPVSELIRDLTERPKVLLPNRARRGAESLGLATDQQSKPEEAG